MHKLFIYFIVLVYFRDLVAQNYSYDTSLANNCSKARIIVVNNKSIFLPKGVLYKQGYLLYNHGYISGGHVLLENKDTVYYSGGGGFYTGKEEEYIDEYKKLNWKKVLSKQLLHYLVQINNFTDSILLPRCGSYESNILSINFVDSSIVAAELQTECFCKADSIMYGVFIDHKTGEEIWIGNQFSFVKYRSKMQPQWRSLLVLENENSVCVSFSNLINDKNNSYVLFFKENRWIIPGSFDIIRKINTKSPQSFYKKKG